ncbi:MAG TPA: serine hydrolase domain-containing protein [Terriglobales bacterium]|nr:serine hydrolase domain-containing protein [Terriglobales bacterium]
MNRIARGTALVMAVLSAVFAFAGDRELAARASKLFEAIPDTSPGAAVMVIHDGNVVMQRGYGATDLRTQHKIDEHTNFRLASLTKQFTAAAIMLLVHDGKLRYEQNLTQIFPDFPAYGKAITVRQLLNHTSGLLDYEDLMTAPPADTPPDQIPQIFDAGVLALMKKAKTTKFPPGSKWAYSNSGYCVLAMVVEKVSGKSFPDFLQQRIFQPLHMTQTIAYVKGKNEVQNRAYGHTRDGNGFRETDRSPTSATLGDGGVYTSLADLAKWDEALTKHTLLSAKEMQPALTAVQPSGGRAEEDGHEVLYGFGWFVSPYKNHERMWHYGETIGFRTSIQRFPKEKLTVVVLCNRADMDAVQSALELADLFMGDETY